jgi:hypothetical protein
MIEQGEPGMKLILNGKDRTADIGARVVEEAARLKAGGSIGALSPEHTALRLMEYPSRDDYQRRFIDLLNMRHGVRTADYYIPRGPGLRGRMAVALKAFLWKLLRYQHDRISHQQNLINELSINAQAFQRDRMEQELKALKDRIEILEKGTAKGSRP